MGVIANQHRWAAGDVHNQIAMVDVAKRFARVPLIECPGETTIANWRRPDRVQPSRRPTVHRERRKGSAEAVSREPRRRARGIELLQPLLHAWPDLVVRIPEPLVHGATELPRPVPDPDDVEQVVEIVRLRSPEGHNDETIGVADVALNARLREKLELQPGASPNRTRGDFIPVREERGVSQPPRIDPRELLCSTVERVMLSVLEMDVITIALGMEQQCRRNRGKCLENHRREAL